MSLTQSSTSYLDAADQVASTVVASHAIEVDRRGQFPRPSIDALARAGLLGLISERDLGGMGEGIRAAALVVERLARECGSTAMVPACTTPARRCIEKHGPEVVRRDIAAGRHLEHARVLGGRLAQPLLGAGEHRVPRDGNGFELDAREELGHLRQPRRRLRLVEPTARGRGPSTLWLVPAHAPGLTRDGAPSTGSACAATTRAGHGRRG